MLPHRPRLLSQIVDEQKLITFPIMITICGAAFYVVILLGGVTTDRSTAVQDDPMLASAVGAYALRQITEALG